MEQGLCDMYSTRYSDTAPKRPKPITYIIYVCLYCGRDNDIVSVRKSRIDRSVRVVISRIEIRTRPEKSWTKLSTLLPKINQCNERVNKRLINNDNNDKDGEGECSLPPPPSNTLSYGGRRIIKTIRLVLYNNYTAQDDDDT